jgi:hypothetical protein
MITMMMMMIPRIISVAAGGRTPSRRHGIIIPIVSRRRRRVIPLVATGTTTPTSVATRLVHAVGEFLRVVDARRRTIGGTALGWRFGVAVRLVVSVEVAGLFAAELLLDQFLLGEDFAEAAFFVAHLYCGVCLCCGWGWFLLLLSLE